MINILSLCNTCNTCNTKLDHVIINKVYFTLLPLYKGHNVNKSCDFTLLTWPIYVIHFLYTQKFWQASLIK